METLQSSQLNVPAARESIPSQPSAVRYLIIFASITAGLSGLIALANFLVDPLQFYRRASYTPYFSQQTRYQNPSLARTYPGDTIFLGTSLSYGFDLDQAQKLFGGEPLNLSMHGASAREQSLLLEIALRTRKVRRVIWDVNWEFCRGRADWVSDFDGVFPAYLYDTNPLNELPNYLLNLDTTKDTTRIFLQHAGFRMYQPQAVQELSALSPGREWGINAVRRAWERARSIPSHFTQRSNELDFAHTVASFNDNFLRIVRAHPNVQFDLHLPPFSTAFHAFVREVAPSAFEDMLRWRSYVQQALAPLPNVQLHDFQGNPELITRFEHYSDLVHTGEAAHKMMLTAIAERRALATSDRIAETNAFLRSEATSTWMLRTTK